MKRNAIKVLAVLFFLSLMFTACKKDLSENKSTEQNLTTNKMMAAKQQHFFQKDLKIKTITTPRRFYVFFYNQRGDVDSVQAKGHDLNYTYIVHRRGNRIDSVTFVRDGNIELVNTNIQYKGNHITQFDFYCRRCNDPVPTVRTFSYDQKGRIIEVGDQQLTYDNNNNVIQWTHPGLPVTTATYTYDDKLNPLYAIDNLFVIFVEETYLWQYAFSQHNSLTKTYSDGLEVGYQNQYSNSNQLQAKTFYDPYGTNITYFDFTYY